MESILSEEDISLFDPVKKIYDKPTDPDLMKQLLQIRREGYRLLNPGNYFEIINNLVSVPWSKFVDEWALREVAAAHNFYLETEKTPENTAGKFGLFRDLKLRKKYAGREEMLGRVEYLKMCGENPGSFEEVLEAVIFISRHQKFRAYDYAFMFKMPPLEIAHDNFYQSHWCAAGLVIRRKIVFHAARGRKNFLIKK